MIIDYGVVDRAIKFYQSNGYNYMEVPWVVDKIALNITAPIDRLNTDKCLVSSGEQSFLKLATNNATTLPIGKNCCATPCYRPHDICDDTHFTQFFKVELISYIGYLSDQVVGISACIDMAKTAMGFMANERKQQSLPSNMMIVNTPDDCHRLCQTIANFDIVLRRENKPNLELGSYGIRKYGGHTWIYGTGVATPRIHM